MKFVSINRLFLFGLFAACSLMCGCGKDSTAYSDYKAWLLEIPNPFDFHAGDPVLAQEGGVVLRASEYKSWVQRYLPGASGSNLSAVDRRRFLDQLLERKMMIRLAKDSGVQLDPGNRQTLEDMEYNFLRSASLRKVVVTEDEMKNYYHLHAKEFISEEVVISHISVTSAAQAAKFKALFEKEKPLPGIKAERVSRLPVPGHAMDYQFINFVFEMKPGQVSGPQWTPWGYVLIRRERMPPPAPPPYEAVRDRVRESLESQKLEAFYKQRMSGMNVTVDEILLNSLDLTRAPNH